MYNFLNFVFYSYKNIFVGLKKKWSNLFLKSQLNQ